MEESTYIFFSADHGLAVGHHGLFGKQNLYEHSTRVPFIIKGPDIPKGKVVSAPIYLQDVMATSLAIAEIEKPKHVEFNNILPLARGETKKSPYKEIYGAYLNVQRSITKNNIKLIVYPNVPLIRVFDISKDPDEKNDIASTGKGQKLKLRLFPLLLKLQKQMGDQLDIAKSFPQLGPS